MNGKCVELHGSEIEIDLSGGQGHCWRKCDVMDMPADVAEEIIAEIIDGGASEHDDYLASNGQHYRW